MARFMIEDTNKGFRISLVEQAGMHEDTFTVKVAYDVFGSHSYAAKAYQLVEYAYRDARRLRLED